MMMRDRNSSLQGSYRIAAVLKMDGVASKLRIFIGIVFLGWILIWILMPTDPWGKEWKPRLKKHTDSTYFGSYGTNLLLYTFPVMLMAALGCIYVYIAERKPSLIQKRAKNEKHWLRWNRPVLVRGPLGIVSAAELAFTILFVALLVWLFTTFCAVGLPKITMAQARKYDETLWQAKLWSASIYMAFVGVLCTAFLFFPVSRSSVILKVAGLSFEESIKYHIWLGHVAMVFFTLHGICYVIIWAAKNEMHEMLTWVRMGTSNLAGEISWFCGFLMWITTFPYIRRKMFELFFYTHQLYIGFVIFYAFHVGAGHFYMFLPGVYLFIVDRFLRFLQSRQPARLLYARVLPCHIVELTFSKRRGLNYPPMSTVFINIPSISTLQWHPFSVTSDSNLEKDKLTVAIKSEGRWSEALYQKLSSKAATIDRLDVVVEGPYGPPSHDYLRHDALVMISGGVGITPFFSIIRRLVSEKSAHIPKLLLVCAFKNSADLAMLDLLLPLSHSSGGLNSLNLQIKAYVTRENEVAKNQDEAQTIWFKSNPDDAPISWPLGRNNWLWMGAVISASFVLFLLLLGIFTRFFTYPMESSNSKYMYPTWLRALFIMLFMFGSIVIVSTVATLWVKFKEAREGGTIGNLEMQRTSGTTGPVAREGEKDVESLPGKPLAETTEVHYGNRPDFGKILGQWAKQSNDVGVMVCGPSGMREDVADICSSAKEILEQCAKQSNDVVEMVCRPSGMREDVADICSSAKVKNLHFHAANIDR